MTSVYDHKDYKAVIQAKIRENKEIYGYKTKLAAAAGCELSFLSRILKSKEDLLPDHALGMARSWGLSEAETLYFLDLLHFARARSRELKGWYKDRIERAQEEKQKSQRKLDMPEVPGGALAVYCSSWHYIAAFVALGIPGLDTAEAMARRLRIPEIAVRDALQLLEKEKIAIRSPGKPGAPDRWRSNVPGGLQVPNEHPLKKVLISLLIQKAAQNALMGSNEEALNYAVLDGGSPAEYRESRRLLSEYLAKHNALFRDAKPEDVYLLTIHFAPI